MNNTKKSFGAPPKNRGPGANEKMLRQISRYCFALAARAIDAVELSEQLKSVGKELDVYADTVSKKIDIYPNIYALQGCLVNIKAAVDLRADHSEAMARLLDEKKALVELLKLGVDSLDDDPFRNKALKRFIVNKRQVEATYITAQVNLKIAQQAKKATAVAVWQNSCTVLKNIMDGLNDLESFTTVSPSLVSSVNRVVNPKQLADFFNKPIRAQRESLKMHTRLCIIINNIIEALNDMNAIDAVKTRQLTRLPHATEFKGAAMPTTIERTDNNDLSDDSNDDSTGAVSVG